MWSTFPSPATTRSAVTVLLFILIRLTLQAQPGTIDLTFGDAGIVNTGFHSTQHAFGNHILVQPDDHLIVSGNTNQPNGQTAAVLVRYKENGDPDLAFNQTGRIIITIPGHDCYANASALQPDNKIVTVAGISTDTTQHIGVFRFNANGTPDLTFGEQGTVELMFEFTYHDPRAVVVQPDGKYVIAGYCRNADASLYKFFVLRLLTDGTPDPAFHGSGYTTVQVGESWLSVYDMLLQPDGKIVTTGYAMFGGYECMAVLRMHANGTLDETFGQQGVAIAAFPNGNTRAYEAALQDDGKIALAGYFDGNDEKSDFGIARLLPNGMPDPEFDNDGRLVVDIDLFSDGARSLIVQPDGKILVGGYAHSDAAGSSDIALIRLLNDGVPDLEFGTSGIAVFAAVPNNSDGISHMALQHDGKVVTVGYFRYGDFNRIGLSRFHTGIEVSTSVHDFHDQTVRFYPNPARGRIKIEYTLIRPGKINIELYDTSGRRIAHLLSNAMRSAGIQFEDAIIPAHIAPGIYSVMLHTGADITSQKLIIE